VPQNWKKSMAEKTGKCDCAAGNQVLTGEARLGKVLDKYRHKPGSLITVLQLAQGIYGYLPEPVLERISEELREPMSKVFGIVTFYSFFSREPRGKYLIRVCMGTACYVLNAQGVLDALAKELCIDVGQTTEDKLFTLETGRCFGACGLAPVITVNDRVHQRVAPADVPGIIGRYRDGEGMA
jgi:NADH:ubiquinone oxidoreductase subunit E